MGAVAAQPAPAPTIQWSPSVITHTIGNGSASDLLEASFTSSENLSDVTVFITPNLRPFIQLESLEFAQVSAGTMYVLRGLFVVPPGADAGVYDGTIHLRLGNRTVARPLSVTLTVDYGDTQVPETTEVVSDTAAAQIKDIVEDETTTTIVFEESAAEIREVVAGDVLVLGVTPQTPNGMLRKVDEIIDTGTELQVVTSEATLEDAFEDATVSLERPLTAEDVEQVFAVRQGVEVMTATPETMSMMASPGAAEMALEFYMSLNDVVLYDRDGDRNTEYDQIRANGTVSLSPSLEFGLSIKSWSLRYFKVAVGIQQQAELSVTSGVSVSVADLQKCIPVSTVGFRTIKIWVGWVPIYIKPSVELCLGLDGSVSANVTAGVSEQFSARAGVQYSSAATPRWTPIAEASFNFDADPPTVNGSFNLKAYGGPKLSLLIYNVAGPYVFAHAYLELEAELLSDPWWTLYAGLEAGAGIRVKILSKTLVDQDFPLTLGVRTVLLCQPDKTPPVVTVPEDRWVDATSSAGAFVTFQVTAIDNRDGELAASCDYPSGSTFPLGTTTVTCTATDAANNTGWNSFAVTVVDATAPVVTVPPDITAEATGPTGAVVTFTVTASDNIDGALAATCDQPSGSTFPIGTTTVTCTATDAAANTGTESFTVTVLDAFGRTPGSLIAWGYNYSGVTDVPEGDDFVAISSGTYHNLALRADGTVVAWGANYFGEGVVPDGLTDVIAIAAGTYHNLAVRADGTVVAWGRNQYGETSVPDGLSDVVAVAAKQFMGSLALKADGSMVAWGGYTMTPTGNDFVAITAGGYVTLGLRADGSLEDTYPYYVTPTGGMLTIPHPEGNDFAAIAAAYSHVLAAKVDGTVVAWGVSTYGETVVPDGLSDVVAVAAGGSGPWGGGHSLALKADGTVVGWGYNADGQTNVPARNDFVAIAAGKYHSLAIVR